MNKMTRLKLKKFKIEFPEEVLEHTEQEFQDWLNYECKLTNFLSQNHPLFNIRLKDCKTSCESATLDGKEIDINELLK
jgi:hypothetical protein